MKTAVMVALAFARNAEILVLDEPTGGLDPMNQRHVLSLMINEAAKATGDLLVASDRTSRACGRADRGDRSRTARAQGLVDDLKGDRKIVEGIFPNPGSPRRHRDDPNVARVTGPNGSYD